MRTLALLAVLGLCLVSAQLNAVESEPLDASAAALLDEEDTLFEDQNEDEADLEEEEEEEDEEEEEEEEEEEADEEEDEEEEEEDEEADQERFAEVDDAAENSPHCSADTPLVRQAAWLAQMAYNTQFHSDLTWKVGDTLTFKLDSADKKWQVKQEFNKESIGAFAQIWVNAADKVVAFAIAGTRSLNGWKTNFSFMPTQCTLFGNTACGKTHTGFHNQALFFLKESHDAVFKVLTPLLQAGYKLIVTGESLGAAVCPLVAAGFQLELKSTKVYSYAFGVPIVGDATFTQFLDNTLPGAQNLRFTNDFTLKTCLGGADKGQDSVAAVSLPGYTKTGVDCRLACKFSTDALCTSPTMILPYGLACHHPREYVKAFDSSIKTTTLTQSMLDAFKFQQVDAGFAFEHA